MSLATRARFYALAARCAASVAARRIVRGPARPGWSFLLETTVAALKAQTPYLLSLPEAEHRAHQDAIAMPILPGTVKRKRVSIRGVWCEWIIPHGCDNAPVLIYLHGGGYVIGSIATHGALVANLARRARCRVLFPEYRLAPEHPHPAALDDATGVFLSLVGQGIDPSRIVIGGDSAGGNLAIATMLRLRDAGDPLPGGALLLCPWLDLDGDSPSATSNLAYDWGDRDLLHYYAGRYVPSGPRSLPILSPLYADLRGLPRMHVQVGSAELLHDEVVTFAERARAAGTSIDLRVWPDMVHDWQLFAPLVHEANEALDVAAAFARDVFQRVPLERARLGAHALLDCEIDHRNRALAALHVRITSEVADHALHVGARLGEGDSRDPQIDLERLGLFEPSRHRTWARVVAGDRERDVALPHLHEHRRITRTEIDVHRGLRERSVLERHAASLRHVLRGFG